MPAREPALLRSTSDPGRDADHARKGCGSFPTHLVAWIKFSEVAESVKRCRRQGTIPIGFACNAAKRVSSVSPHPGHWIVKHRHDRGDGSNVGNVVENLDAVPPHTGVAIREALDDSSEAIVTERCRAEICGGDSSGQPSQGVEFAALDAEQLHEFQR